MPAPDDANYFPLVKGRTLTYSSTNTKHMPKPEVEQFTVDSAAQASARFTVKSVSGPMKVAGTYGFSTRPDGITNLLGRHAGLVAAQVPAARAVVAARREAAPLLHARST